MSQEFNIRVDHFFHFPRDPGHGEILTAIREVKDLTMNLTDTVTQLAADDNELAADVTALVAIINDIPNRTNAAVAAALANAGVTGDAAVAALNAVDLTVKDAITAAKSVLPASVPTPPSGTDTSTGSDTTTSTIGGGTGNDTIGGGSSTDILLIGTVEFDTGVVGAGFTGDVQINQGTAPYNVTASPPSQNGLSVGSDGTITGTPSSAGSFPFAYSITDSATPPNTGSGTVTVVVAEAAPAA